MYKILLLDDRRQSRISLEERFISKNMEVFSCRNIYEANDIWGKMKGELDAIVIDMMMPSLGMSESLHANTNEYKLTGWIWLWRNLNPNNEDPHPAVDKCIVIYSAYLPDFDKYINSNQLSKKEKEFADRVKCIPKGFNNNEKDVLDILINDRAKKASALC